MKSFLVLPAVKFMYSTLIKDKKMSIIMQFFHKLVKNPERHAAVILLSAVTDEG
jgi:hypothetical protein